MRETAYIDKTGLARVESMDRLPEGEVTFVFTDIEGSTRLWNTAPNAMREALRIHDAIIDEVVVSHGGTSVKPRGEGDSSFLVFEDPLTAVAAVSDIQVRFWSEHWTTPTPVRVRAAVNTGQADVRLGDYYGPAVNKTARLRDLLQGGQTVMSHTTYELVRYDLPIGVTVTDLGDQSLRDLTELEHVYQLNPPGVATSFSLGAAPTLVIRLLGPMEVESSGLAVELSSPTQRAILAFLSLHVNESIGWERLIDAVWGAKPPSSGRKAVAFHISSLRDSLVPGRKAHTRTPVETTAEGYVLRIPRSNVDIYEFEELVAHARGVSNLDDRVRSLDHALSLWRGRLFSGMEYEEFTFQEANRLEELKMEAQDELWGSRLDRGEHQALVPSLVAAVAESPLRERRHAQLMTALYRSDRQVDALRAYQDLRNMMAHELGIEPSHETRRLEERILLQDQTLREPAPTVVPNLPAYPNSFIGRRSELKTVEAALSRGRIATLVGIGGIGKTRLSIELAGRLAGSHRDGCVYVNLAETVDAAYVPDLLIEAVLGGNPHDKEHHGVIDDLIDLIRAKSLLLVLDNVEHVLEGVAPVVEKVVSACPGVRILATSRLPLVVYGERVINVGPMEVPNGGDDVNEVDSVELLRDRSSLGEIDEPTREAIVSICRAAGGVPLALELAASLLSSMPIDSVAERIVANIGVVDSETDRAELGTLDDVLEWSLRRLADGELESLSGLSVFRGGFDTDSASAVLAGVSEDYDRDLETLLGSLVRQGLVRMHHDGSSYRYSLLEPVRQRVEQNSRPSVLASAVEAHISYFSSLAEQAQQSFEAIAADALAWLERLEREKANLRAMLERGIERGDATVLRAIPGLVLFWYRTGRIAEGSKWVDRCLEAFSDLGDDHLQVLLFGAHIAMWNSQPNVCLDRLDRFEKRMPDLEASPFAARAKHTRGNLYAWGLGMPGEAVPHFEEAMEIARRTHYPTGLTSLLSVSYNEVKRGAFDGAAAILEQVPGFAQMTAVFMGMDSTSFADFGTEDCLGMIDLYSGDHESAAERISKALGLAREIGLSIVEGSLLTPLGWSLLLAGDIEGADEAARRAYTTVQESNAGWRIADPMCLFGGIELERGNLLQAARWFARAIGKATRAPEHDLVVWALAGLSAVDRVRGRTDAADHFRAHYQSVTARASVVLPMALIESWGLEATVAVDCDLIGVEGELSHLVNLARFDTGTEWKEML